MRDIAITLLVFAGCLYTFKRAYVGVLLWSLLSYMNPHRLTYGFAYNMPFAQLTAICLFVSLFLTKERGKFPINSITIIWISFVIFMGITTLFAFFPEDANVQYIKVIKIQLIVFVTMILINDMNKLIHLLWVIVVSIGYYSAKGGLFTIATGGGFIVYGPDGSFIAGNNELAIAALMTIPLMAYLYKISVNKWVRRGLMVAMPLSLVAAIGTQSRGALLAFIAVMLFFWLKSDRKVILGVGITIISIMILALMPDTWYKRMDTIQTYEEDSSAMGRINAWEYAYNAANHNILGVGFDSWSPITFAMYAPNPRDVHAAHSIYFSVLADHGWIGLIMFLSIFYLSWRRLKSLIKTTSNQEDSYEINLLTRMLQVSLIAYFVGGAFLSLSYFDLPWHLLSFIQIISRIIDGKNDTKIKRMQKI
jgi:probable O-glycosylation ligase (exosortase A-associated)